MTVTTPLIEWSKEFSVGIEEIDEQHKLLVELLNATHAAIQQRRSSEMTKEILGKLIDYAKLHFAVEESLMRLLNYADYEEHKEQHRILMENIGDLSKKLESGKMAVGFELQHFLRNWLIKHILENDKRYTKHFIRCGIQTSLSKPSWISKLWEW